MSKLEDDRAKLARVLDCRPSTLDHWFDLLGLLDEAGALGSQLTAIGAAVEMKRGNRLAGQSLNRLFLELASQSEESGGPVGREPARQEAGSGAGVRAAED